MTNLPLLNSTMNTSQHDLVTEFFKPCLNWAHYYDRAVGYFTSNWVKVNAQGMSSFAAKGGRARWIVSPNIEEEDYKAIIEGFNEPDNIELLRVMKDNIEELTMFLEEKTRNAIAWLIYDGIIELKIAIPKVKLEGGEFHDKFGIFKDKDGNVITFNGSVNDSKKGFVNYESIKIFKSWEGMEGYTSDDIARFERLWNNLDENLRVCSLTKAIEEEIFKLRTTKRPYSIPSETESSEQWLHQKEAIEIFMNKKNGILEMATGTGKTRTAIGIIKELFSKESISSVIVTVSGTDLLNQWYKELHNLTDYTIFRYFSTHKELSDFKITVGTRQAILVVSREFLPDVAKYIPKDLIQNSLIVCDEVHGMGSESIIKNLKGKINIFKYRLGLSATPEREYGDEGNDFIKSEIGEVIYRFGLEDAIRKGILCEFDYYPLEFSLTEKDKKAIQKVMANYHLLKKSKNPMSLEELYRRIAFIRKTSHAKLPIFEQFLSLNDKVLDRALIFTETKEYGMEVQNIIIRYIYEYHTYYGEDGRINLELFSQGKLRCLLTCKRISEGIDIKTVNNIILFSADRAKLQTIQRIGRSLRVDPENPGKRATVVDFICINEGEPNDPENTDIQRRDWLKALSNVRREC